MRLLPAFFLLTGMIVFALACHRREAPAPDGQLRQSGAAQSLDQWFLQRMDAQGRIPTQAYLRAFAELQGASLRGNGTDSWSSIGPNNIGGRTLCLAFHPQDPQVVFAGSASGGLWVTRTGGIGPAAWEPVPTGFPVLAVADILIHPQDPQRMWLATGEMYSNGVVRPGTINRFTRGTYGIGILRSLDGGQTWAPSLDWSYGDMRGVQKLAMNPKDPQQLYAATSEGLYRSYNGGDSWHLAFSIPMVTDIVVHALDTQIVLISSGSYFTANAALYRSENSGQTFAKVNTGIPEGYTGKASLAGDPVRPDTMYAYVADANAGKGLYRSVNTGISWSLVNATDVSLWQGWYSHELAINPTNPDQLLVAGVDVYRSPNGGQFLLQAGIWEAGSYGKVPAGGPEGPPYYVHADVHGVYYHPLKPGEAWFATDGGMFVSPDGGLNFEGRNGGYQTQQFYARFGTSGQLPVRSIGGLQDNATVIYDGDKEWTRVIGGDGMHAAIDPQNSQRMLASIPHLVLYRSLDQGGQFLKSDLPFLEGERRAFNGPFVIDPHQTNRVLAGGQRLYRSTQFAAPGSWEPLQTTLLDPNRMITHLAIAPDNPQRVLAVTAADPLQNGGASSGQILLSNQGGQGTAWTIGAGLPARHCSSAAFHPLNSDTIMATFMGFGGPPLWRSVNGGQSWAPWGSGLPAIPANVVIYDPFQPNHLYLGNDLSVYFSEDGGASWTPFAGGLPEATLVMDLVIHPVRKVVQAATHGRGAWEAALRSQTVALDPLEWPEAGALLAPLMPNPSDGRLLLRPLDPHQPLQLTLYDRLGRIVAREQLAAGAGQQWWTLPSLPAGLYLLEARSGLRRHTQRVLLDPR